MSKPEPAAHSQSGPGCEIRSLSPFMPIAILLTWPWPGLRPCLQLLLMLVHTHRHTHSLHLHTRSLGSAIFPLPHTTCRWPHPRLSPLLASPFRGLHSTPWRALSRGWVGVSLCYLCREVRNTRFYQRGPSPPDLDADSAFSLPLHPSLALERSYPSSSSQCLSLENPALA